MEKTFEVVFKDVFGGDGQIRYMDVEVPKLKRTKKTSRTKSDIGIAIESSVDELMTETVKREVHTFRYQNGKPTLRLGGTHGKLWGALEEGRRTQFMLGDASFRGRIMDVVQIKPVWVELEPLEEMKVEVLPQKLNVPGGRSMTFPQFDVVPRCKCTVTVAYPDNIHPLVDKLLDYIKTMGMLNKRRATIESMEEVN